MHGARTGLRSCFNLSPAGHFVEMIKTAANHRFLISGKNPWGRVSDAKEYLFELTGGNWCQVDA
jgi:hypothetical protein